MLGHRPRPPRPEDGSPIDLTDLAGAATDNKQPLIRARKLRKEPHQQATRQSTKAAQHPTQPAAKQSGEQASEHSADPHPEMNTKIGNSGDAIDKSAEHAAQQASVPKQSQGLGPTQRELSHAAARSAGDLETVSGSADASAMSVTRWKRPTE